MEIRRDVFARAVYALKCVCADEATVSAMLIFLSMCVCNSVGEMEDGH